MGHAALGRRRIVGGHDVYYLSDDGGETWHQVSPALPGTDIHAVAAEHPATFYAFVVGHGLFRSPDGERWEAVSDSLPESTVALAVVPGDGRPRIFSGGTHGLLVSDDGGRSWNRVAGSGPTPSLATPRVAPATLYAVWLGLLSVSRDSGRSWSRVRGAPESAFLVAASDDGAWLYVLTRPGLEVWRSEDAGGTWRRADQ